MPVYPNTTISQFIPQQMPEFVRENYTTFITFLQAYYEWMEESGNLVDRVSNLLSYNDIDTTLNEFIYHFEAEFLENVPASALVDKKILVKHIKEFYRAKGTEKAYKFLFRILFNEDVEFYYPGLDLLRPSDGKWSVDTVLRCTTINDTFTYVAHQIQGKNSGATANVENVIQYNSGFNLVTQLYLSSISGVFVSGEEINIIFPTTTLVETLYSIVTGVTVTNPGLGYKENDTVLINGGGGVDAVAFVDSVIGQDTGRVVSSTDTTLQLQDGTATASCQTDENTGKVVRIDLIEPGFGYASVPTVTATGGGASVQATFTAVLNTDGSVKVITITTHGVGYTSQPTITISHPKVTDYYKGLSVTITDGVGAAEAKPITAFDPATQTITVESAWINNPDITSHYSIDLGQISTVKIRDFGVDYTGTPTANFTRTGKGNATGTVQTGVLGLFPGRWVTTDSFLDSNKRIQDSLFWQNFSYVLRLGQSLNTYADVVKKLLHPSGTILFGEVDIVDHLLLGPTYRNLERHKFYFAPYNHYGPDTIFDNYQTNVGADDGQTNPLYSFPSPNASYFGSATGNGNTQNSIYANTVIDDVVSRVDTKRNHVADSYIRIERPNASPSQFNLIAEYNMVLGADDQTLYDIKNGHDGHLGSTQGNDDSDPIYTSIGLTFTKAAGLQFATSPVTPSNKQTIVIAGRVTGLGTKQSIIGSLDTGVYVSGYAIDINTDGSVTFRVQKLTDTQNDLSITSDPGLIVPGQWFYLFLRYSGNKLTGNVLTGSTSNEYSISYGSNVDGGAVQNNSGGYVIGNEGALPVLDNSLYGETIYGATLFGHKIFTPGMGYQLEFDPTQDNTDSTFGRLFDGGAFFGGPREQDTVINDTTETGNFFYGDVGYVLIYDDVISDPSLVQNYAYIKSQILARGTISQVAAFTVDPVTFLQRDFSDPSMMFVNGAYYIVGGSLTKKTMVFRSLDKRNWTVQNLSGSPDQFVTAHAVQGNNIVLATWTVAGDLNLYNFNTSSNTYGAAYGTTTYVDTQVSFSQLRVLSNGSIIGAYAKGDNKLYYRKYSSGSWGSPVQANTSTSTSPPDFSVIQDPDDGLTFIYDTNAPSGPTYSRRLDSGGTLGTEKRIDTAIGQTILRAFQNGTYFDGKLYIPITNDTLSYPQVIVGSPYTNPTWTLQDVDASALYPANAVTLAVQNGQLKYYWIGNVPNISATQVFQHNFDVITGLWSSRTLIYDTVATPPTGVTLNVFYTEFDMSGISATPDGVIVDVIGVDGTNEATPAVLD